MNENQKDGDLKFWCAFHDVLKDARDTLPYADEPTRVHWSDPDDDWKNEAAEQADEDACSSDTDALVRHYCLKRSWPKRSKNNARLFAKRRFQWAIGFARVFTIPLPETAAAAIPRPQQSGWKLLEWLLIDAYHQRFPPPPKTPFYISGADGKMTTVWT